MELLERLMCRSWLELIVFKLNNNWNIEELFKLLLVRERILRVFEELIYGSEDGIVIEFS